MHKAIRLVYAHCSARTRLDPIFCSMADGAIIHGGIGSPCSTYLILWWTLQVCVVNKHEVMIVCMSEHFTHLNAWKLTYPIESGIPTFCVEGQLKIYIDLVPKS